MLTSYQQRKYLAVMMYVFPAFVVFLIGTLLYVDMYSSMTEQIEVRVDYTTGNVAMTETYVVNGSAYVSEITFLGFGSSNFPDSVIINYDIESPVRSCIKKECNSSIGVVISIVTKRVAKNT